MAPSLQLAEFHLPRTSSPGFGPKTLASGYSGQTVVQSPQGIRSLISKVRLCAILTMLVMGVKRGNSGGVFVADGQRI